MAIQKNIEISGRNVIHAEHSVVDIGNISKNFNCYIKVNSVSSTKDNATAFVQFNDIEHNNYYIFDKKYNFNIDLEGGNPIKQAYLHLKTLPEFVDAVDC